MTARSLILCFIVFSRFAHAYPAQETSDTPYSPDQFHDSVSLRVMSLANRIDNFFGEKRALDAKNKSSMVLSQTQNIPEGGIPGPSFSASLNLRLVNLEKVGKKLEDSVLGRDQSGKSATSSSGENKSPPETETINPWRLSLDQQVGAKWLPSYTIKLRLTKDFWSWDFLNHFAQEAGWDSDNLWTTRTSFVSDYALSSNWLYRWSNDGTWFVDRHMVTSSHGPSFIHTINEKTSMSYNLRLETEYIEKILYTSGYLASITFRRDLHNRWLYLDLVPSVTFPRVKDFTRVLNFAIRLEVIFGDL